MVWKTGDVMEAEVAARAPPVSLQLWALWSSRADFHLPVSASLCLRAFVGGRAWDELEVLEN